MLAAAAWDVLIMQSKQLIESLKGNDLTDKKWEIANHWLIKNSAFIVNNYY